jgi:hypothetical protein
MPPCTDQTGDLRTPSLGMIPILKNNTSRWKIDEKRAVVSLQFSHLRTESLTPVSQAQTCIHGLSLSPSVPGDRVPSQPWYVNA